MDATDLRRSQRRWALAAGLLLLAIPFFVPIPDELRRSRLLSRLSDLAHLPVLALVTYLLQARGPIRGRPAAAAAAAALVSVLVEAGQAFTGREPMLVDLFFDAVGIAGGLAWFAWQRRRPRREAILAAAAVAWLAASAWHLAPVPGYLAAERWARGAFPLLAGFETRVELPNWEAAPGGAIRIVADGPGGPADGRFLRLVVDGPGPYPAAVLHGFPRDWRGRTHLQWRARAPQAERPLTYGLRLDDFAGRQQDWAARSFSAGPEWQEQEVDLEALPTVSGRPLDLAGMRSVLFFFARVPLGTTLELDDVRLR